MQRKYQLMHLYSVRKFSFCKVYTAFVGNLFYRLLHKYIPCAVCWKASKTSTLIRNRRTLGEPFVDFAQLTASLHMKTANIKKVILLKRSAAHDDTGHNSIKRISCSTSTNRLRTSGTIISRNTLCACFRQCLDLVLVHKHL